MQKKEVFATKKRW